MSKHKDAKTIKQRGRSAPGSLDGTSGAMLAFLKRKRAASVAELAAHLRISYEGARQHVGQLRRKGLIERNVVRAPRASAGRPVAHYALSREGDHLFPKSYDELTVELIDALTERLGDQALKQVLATFTDKRVHRWSGRLEGKSLKQRVAELKSIYGEDDPFMTVEMGRDSIRLIERNCPFLNVASRRPALCSVTVSTLQRLLGVKVVREERFQSGHGRCAFRIFPHRPINVRRHRFTLESEGTDTPS